MTAVDSAVHSVELKTETIQTGPETITTTVEEFASGTADAGSVRAASALPGSEPASVVLVKRTVTVDQRGPALQQTTLQGNRDADTQRLKTKDSDTQASSKSATSAGCTFGLGVWGLVALGVLGAGAWLYLKGVLPWK